MPSTFTNDDAKKVRLWCIAAKDMPIAAVFARCFAEERWTCVLRWNWRSGSIEEGAWTKLDINARHCTLSPNAEFLMYRASGPMGGPFRADNGGAYAISRLPWLAALTNPETFGPAGGGDSVHALKPKTQEKLWAIFAEWFDFPHHATRLGGALGRPWSLPTDDQQVLPGVTPRVQLDEPLVMPIPGTELTLVAVADCPEDSCLKRHDWSVWRNDLRFFVTADDQQSKRVLELTGVRWATAVKGGQVLVATAEAKLGILQFKRHDQLREVPPLEKPISLDGLTPRPGPAPSWAMAEVWK